MADNIILPNGLIGRTGAIPTAPEIIAARRAVLARAGRLAALHGIRTTPSLPVINSAAAVAALGLGGLGWMGNVTLVGAPGYPGYGDCCAAAEGHRKQIITSATGATLLTIPQGGTGTGAGIQWGTGLTTDVPANTPGVIAWAQANGILNGATCQAPIQLSGVPLPWPGGGMVDSSNIHHPDDTQLSGSAADGNYPFTIDFTNQTEVTLALLYFKAVILGVGAGNFAWPNSHWINATAGDTTGHALIITDIGTAGQLATPYGIGIPSPYTSSTLCVGGITWGLYFVSPWDSMQNFTSGAWIVPTDPDRGDASTFNPVAVGDYASMLLNPMTPPWYVEQMLCS